MIVKRLATLIMSAAFGLAVLPATASAQPTPTIGIAQRIFQGIEHFDPHDRFQLLYADSGGIYPQRKAFSGVVRAEKILASTITCPSGTRTGTR
jgi:hypothetical protein